MELWFPKRVYIEPGALDYPLGKALYQRFRADHLPITMIAGHNRVVGVPGRTAREAYREGKETLVVGVRRTFDLESCRPSADYQFALVTGCPAYCQYCYLQSSLGRKPYVRVYVNVAEILGGLQETIKARAPHLTTFEAASTADPLAVEHLTGSLRQAVDFFGRQKDGLLRFVTKFTNVDGLLSADHRGHTRFRFSVNTPQVIAAFEHRTPSLEERIEAAKKVAAAGYPLGFLVAPLFIYDGWRRDYRALVSRLADELPQIPDLTFELIQFRFTRRSKDIILDRFPHTALDLDEETRKVKHGKYGQVKYIYPDEEAEALKAYLSAEIQRFFPASRVLYFT